MKRLVLKGDNIQHINLKALKSYILDYNFADIESYENITDNEKHIAEDSRPQDPGEAMLIKNDHPKCNMNEYNKNVIGRIQKLEISLQYKNFYFILVDIDQELVYKLYDLLDGLMFDENIKVECYIIDEKVNCGVKVSNKAAFDLKLKELEKDDDFTNIDQNISEETSHEEKEPVLTNKQLKKREHKKQRKLKRVQEITQRISKRDDGFVFDPDDHRFSVIHTDERFRVNKRIKKQSKGNHIQDYSQ